MSTSHTKVKNKKNLKNGNTQEYYCLPYPKQTLLDFNIFFKLIIIVNTALFVLNFLNLPQGNILARAERHFEELKDTSLPLPIWDQDMFNKQ